MKLAILATVLAASLPISAGAQSFLDGCRDYRPRFGLDDKTVERPEPPSCATMSYLPFDEFSFQSCKRDMEDYRDKVQGFGACLADESNRSVKEYNDAVQSFNKRASQ